MAVIYEKIPECTLGQFSTLKFVNGSNFKKFKEYFLAEYVDGFIVPAETFDNVKGKFPIGFTIWDTGAKSKIKTIQTNVYDKNANYISGKNFYGELPESLNKWFGIFEDEKQNQVGLFSFYPSDFQNNNKFSIFIFKISSLFL
jgi:hypothetical protein